MLFWASASKQLPDLLTALLNSDAVHAVLSVPLVYMIDGHMLRMPIAKRPPKNGYKD